MKEIVIFFDEDITQELRKEIVKGIWCKVDIETKIEVHEVSTMYGSSPVDTPRMTAPIDN